MSSSVVCKAGWPVGAVVADGGSVAQCAADQPHEAPLSWPCD